MSSGKHIERFGKKRETTYKFNLFLGNVSLFKLMILQPTVFDP